MNKYSVHEFTPNAAQIAASKVPYRSGAATAEVVPANGGNGGGNNPDDGMLG